MPKKKYKCTYYEELGHIEPFASHLCLNADSPEEAKQKCKDLLYKLSKDAGYTGKPLVICNLADDMGYPMDFLLDAWYDKDPTSYLECWDVDISDNQMLNCLKKNHPGLYKALQGYLK